MNKIFTPPAAARKRLDWLLRYARRCQLKLDASVPPSNAIKGQFTPAAWRLLCRSGRDSFIPILRNRRLAFDSLVHYAQSLVENGFQVAPHPEFLRYFIQSSYLFFDRMPEVPCKPDEMTLLRLVTRCGGVCRPQLRRVHEWIVWGKGAVTTRMAWRAVHRRADEWHRRQQVEVEQARTSCASAQAPKGWDFACGPVAWEGYDIIPLANDVDLWDEGQAMSSCLYKLRYLCKRTTEPSRFFSVRKEGQRYATLELVWISPHESRHGLGLMDGGWQLQDCRLSCNRLPSDELVRLLDDFCGYYGRLYLRPANAALAAASAHSSSRAGLTVPMKKNRQDLDAANAPTPKFIRKKGHEIQSDMDRAGAIPLQ